MREVPGESKQMNLWRWIVLAAALGPFIYYAMATYCAWDYFRSVRKTPPPEPSFTPKVSILKPVRGMDREASTISPAFAAKTTRI